MISFYSRQHLVFLKKSQFTNFPLISRILKAPKKLLPRNKKYFSWFSLEIYSNPFFNLRQTKIRSEKWGSLQMRPSWKSIQRNNLFPAHSLILAFSLMDFETLFRTKIDWVLMSFVVFGSTGSRYFFGCVIWF
jgi:hypothetical protein